MIAHPLVKTYERTCYACPEQYEGELVDGQFFYVRVRWSHAELGIGATSDAAVEDTIRGHRIRVRFNYDSHLAGLFDSPEQRDAVLAELFTAHPDAPTAPVPVDADPVPVSGAPHPSTPVGG